MAKGGRGGGDASCGANWCKNKNQKKKRGSQTKGKTKGFSCAAGPIDRSMARRNRSYKNKAEYSEWLLRKNGDKGSGVK